MAAIAVTAAQVSLVFPLAAEVFDFIAEEAIERGQLVYVTATGGVKKASAAAAGTAGVRGMALTKAGAGQGISVLKRGHVAGATISGLAYDAAVYAADTAGGLDTAAGTVSVVAGRVVPLSDSARTKVLYFSASW